VVDRLLDLLPQSAIMSTALSLILLLQLRLQGMDALEEVVESTRRLVRCLRTSFQPIQVLLLLLLLLLQQAVQVRAALSPWHRYQLRCLCRDSHPSCNLASRCRCRLPHLALAQPLLLVNACDGPMRSTEDSTHNIHNIYSSIHRSIWPRSHRHRSLSLSLNFILNTTTPRPLRRRPVSRQAAGHSRPGHWNSPCSTSSSSLQEREDLTAEMEEEVSVEESTPESLPRHHCRVHLLWPKADIEEGTRRPLLLRSPSCWL